MSRCKRSLLATGLPFMLIGGTQTVAKAGKTLAITLGLAPSRASDSDIQGAILDGKKHLLSCVAKEGFWREFGRGMAEELAGYKHYSGNYHVTFASNLGLVSISSHHRAQRYEQFTVDNVESILRAPSFTLFISANAVSMGDLMAAGQVSHVVIRRRKTKREDVIQPMNVETDGNVYTNLFGAEFVQSTAIVRFNYRGVLDIASRGDVEAVIITSTGERRCWVDNKKVVEMFDWVAPEPSKGSGK